MVPVFVSWGCCDKLAHTGWLKATEMCSLRVQKAGGQKPRGQGSAGLCSLPPGSLGESPFLHLLDSGGSRCSLPWGCISPASASILSLLFQGHVWLELGPILTQNDLIWRFLTTAVSQLSAASLSTLSMIRSPPRPNVLSGKFWK